MIAGGRLIDPAPIAEWMSAANRLAIASPLGWTPAADGAGIAPTFPIGTSLVMALFTLVGGTSAVYFVAPITGLITLWLVYRLASEWFDGETALLATAIVAWNPLVDRLRQAADERHAGDDVGHACAVAFGPSRRVGRRLAQGSPPARP